MQADFTDALERHWVDAEQLFGAQRWANADHLYGLSAECGLKGLMLTFGMPYNLIRDRPSLREDCVHADGAWVRYESYRCGHAIGAAYVLLSDNPFQDWGVEQRYANQSNFDPSRVQPHQMAAKHVRDLIQQARRAGLIT